MTNEEAEKVIRLMICADGGCFHCAGTLLVDFNETFPEHTELAKMIYKKRFNKELELYD